MDDVGSRVMFFGSFLDMLATRGRTAGARWRHGGPRMGHDSAKMGHDSGKMGILTVFEDFRRWVGKRKTLKNLRFIVFCTFGRLGRGV